MCGGGEGVRPQRLRQRSLAFDSSRENPSIPANISIFLFASVRLYPEAFALMIRGRMWGRLGETEQCHDARRD